MTNPLSWLFDSDSYMPHGHCYLWQPGVLWLHVIADGLIAHRLRHAAHGIVEMRIEIDDTDAGRNTAWSHRWRADDQVIKAIAVQIACAADG